MLRLAAVRPISTARLLVGRLDMVAFSRDGFGAFEKSSPLIEQPPRPSHQRCFSSTSLSKAKVENNGASPLINEHLVSFLVRRSKAANGDAVDVRLVVMEEGKATSSVVSLTNAIQIGSKLGVDLIGINLDQSPPVVKAQDAGKLLYQAEKRTAKSGGNPKQDKEFQFKVGIHENDFSRKIDTMLKFLRNGHDCVVSVRTSGLQRRNNPECLNHFMVRLKDLVDEVASLGKFKPDEENTRGSIRLTPKRAEKS